MPTFTSNWHNQVDQRAKHLAPFAGRPLLALEIGVHEGRSTCWLLDQVLTHPESRLWTVDPFGFAADDSEARREKDAFESPEIKQHRARFFQNVRPYGDRVRHFELRSDEFFATVPKATFDLAVIDGSHAGLQACRDLLHAWQRLVIGGRLVFDDYRWRGDKGFASNGPKRAMDAFLKVVPPEDVEIVYRGYIMILEKLA